MRVRSDSIVLCRGFLYCRWKCYGAVQEFWWSSLLCRPWDRGDLCKRLTTFKSMTWFAKPQVTAVGHASMLAAIQRYVPGLTPSTYGAERLDLLRHLEKVKELETTEVKPSENANE